MDKSSLYARFRGEAVNDLGEIARLAELDESELLKELGQSLRTAATSPGPGGDRRIAIAWIRSHWSQLKQHLCNSTVQQMLNGRGDHENGIRDTAAVIDLILSPFY